MAKRNEQPVSNVKWVDIDNVQANDYNPNSVAKTEMKLLHTRYLQSSGRSSADIFLANQTKTFKK